MERDFSIHLRFYIYLDRLTANLEFQLYKKMLRSMGDVNIGDQTRHRQLEKRLAEVCESQANLKSVNVDDYDF